VLASALGGGTGFGLIPSGEAGGDLSTDREEGKGCSDIQTAEEKGSSYAGRLSIQSLFTPHWGKRRFGMKRGREFLY